MRKRLSAILILAAYSAILFKVIVLKQLPLIRIGHLMINLGGSQEGSPNLVPFKTILPYLLLKRGLMIGFINIVGNILLFVPIGFLVPFINRNFSWLRSLLLSVATGITVEGMQAILRVGIFDIDDVILNAFGVLLGFWAFGISVKRSEAQEFEAETFTFDKK